MHKHPEIEQSWVLKGSFRSLSRPHAAAREIKLPSFPFDKRQLVPTPATESVFSGPTDVICARRADPEFRNAGFIAVFAPVGFAFVNRAI